MYITGRRKQVLDNAARTHTPHSSDKSLSGQIISLGPCDVTNKSDLERLTADLESKEPYLSLVVVAAAGVSGPKGYPDTSDAGQMKSNLWTESVEEWTPRATPM